MAIFYGILGLLAGSLVTILVIYFDEIVFFITASLDEDRGNKGFDRHHRED